VASEARPTFGALEHRDFGERIDRARCSFRLLAALFTGFQLALASDEKQQQSRLLASLPLRREPRADHLGDQYDALPM
jgi:hypothetical protein